MSSGYPHPGPEDIMHTLTIVGSYGGAKLDEACSCCKQHPIVSFPMLANQYSGTEVVEVRGCISCDAMHMWPDIYLADEDDICQQCDDCGGCTTHGCQCPIEDDEENEDVDDVTG